MKFPEPSRESKNRHDVEDDTNRWKLTTLMDIFGTTDLDLSAEQLRVRDKVYPIIDGVIILLPRDKWPTGMGAAASTGGHADYAPDIQQGFGAQWQAFPHVIEDHEAAFHQYFDLVDLDKLREKRVIDLGCGMGRWSHYLASYCRELILVDFSEAIFVARENLGDRPKTLFFMGDVLDLPFRRGAADFAFSLGVLHHTPLPALDAVRRVGDLAPVISVYLYYALDNRPFHFHVLLRVVDPIRRFLCRIKNPRTRRSISFALALGIYKPLVGLGWLLQPLKMSHHVPLYEGYHQKSLQYIRQDAYDRFFTSIERRVTRKEILQLKDYFDSIEVSDSPPYWHFLARRTPLPPAQPADLQDW